MAIRHHDKKHKKKKAATAFFDFYKKLKTVCGTIENVNEWYGYVRELQDLITTYTDIIPSSVQKQLTSATDLIDTTSGGIQKACQILRGELRDFIQDSFSDILQDRINELDQTNGKITPFLKLALAVGGTAGVIAVVVFVLTSSPTPIDISITPPDFQLFSDPTSVSVASGSPARSTISIVAKGGYQQPVTLSCYGLPSSVECGISPSSVIPGQAATVTIATNDPNLSDKFTGTIIGTAGSLTHSINLDVDVQGSKVLTASQYVILLSSKSTDGQNNIGSMTIDSDLHDLPSSIPFTKGSQHNISVNPPPGYAFDHYDMNHISIELKGNQPGGGVASATGDGSILVWFTKQRIFDIYPQRSDVAAYIGERPKIVLVLTSRNGFSGDVNLQISDTGGLGISEPLFNPNPVSLQKDQSAYSTLSFNVLTDPPDKTHYITVMATSGTVSTTTKVTLTVHSVVQPLAALVVTGIPDRDPNQNGWYNSPVKIRWQGHDLAGNTDFRCDEAWFYSGPDSESASVTGNCFNKDGKATLGSFALKYDSTTPTIDIALDPSPNKNGWNNKPVKIIFNCYDEKSGVESCGPNAIISQNTAGQVVNGMANDYAGNINTKSVTVKLDMTPPTFPDLSAYDNANNQLKNGQSMSSNTITFHFSSADNFGLISYQCKLDGNPWSLCSSPHTITLSTNQTGSHTFQVMPYDAADNYGNAAAFTWNYQIHNFTIE